MKSYADQHEYFEFRLCLSREKAKADYENDGYVNAQIDGLDINPSSDHFLLCGNPAMIDDVWGKLKERGVNSRNVVREKYVFARESSRSAIELTLQQKQLIAEKLKKYSKEPL